MMPIVTAEEVAAIAETPAGADKAVRALQVGVVVATVTGNLFQNYLKLLSV